jgi:hypothetical protein
MKHQIGNIYSQIGKTARYYILSIIKPGDEPLIGFINIGSGALKDKPIKLPDCSKSTFENITDKMILKISGGDEMKVFLEECKINDVLYKLEKKMKK